MQTFNMHITIIKNKNLLGNKPFYQILKYS